MDSIPMYFLNNGENPGEHGIRGNSIDEIEQRRLLDSCMA